MSSKVASESDVNKRAGIPLPMYARATIFGVAWLPALCLVAFFVPKFEALFSRLQETAELPAVTEWLLWFTWLDKVLFLFPSVLVLVLLVVADMGVDGLLQGSRRKWLYWIWFGGVVVMGILAAAIVTTALLLLVLKMSASI